MKQHLYQNKKQTFIAFSFYLSIILTGADVPKNKTWKNIQFVYEYNLSALLILQISYRLEKDKQNELSSYKYMRCWHDLIRSFFRSE